VRGYEVVASDDGRMGRVVDVKHGYLVVESGWPGKLRRPVPREFVHVVDEAAKAFVTVPRRVLRDAPHVDRHGNFDLEEAARHYGLTAAPREQGAERQKHLRPGSAGHDRGAPALFGDRRYEPPRASRD
jgi:hypothetical protein